MTGRPPADGEAGPVVAWALAALLAGWVGTVVPSPALVAAAVAMVVGGLAAGARRSGHLRRTVAGGVAIGGIVMALAQGMLALQDRGPTVSWANAGGVATVTLVVVTEPRLTDHGWWAVVRVTSVEDDRDRQRGLLRGDGEPPPLWASWSGPATARPLGRRGFDRYLRDLHGAVEVAPLADPTGWATPGWLGRSTEWLRARIRVAASGPRADDGRGLVVGLATGDTRLLSRYAQDDLRESGLSHLTAVSGANVALVVAAVVWLLAAAPLGPVGRTVAVGAAVTWFAILTRFEPSVLRASTMVGVLGLAAVRRTVPDPRHALASAVLVLVVVDPFLARSLGLLLSASAAAGILWWSRRLHARLSRLPATVAAAVSVTLAAQIGVAPVLLVVEREVGLADLPANLLAVPLAAIASLLGGAGALLAVAHPGVGAPAVSLAAVPARGILLIASTLSGRGPVLGLHRPVSLVAGLAAVVWLLHGRRRVRRAGLVTALACAVVGVLPPPAAAPPNTLTVTAIDVGQGDAILVSAPDGTRVLVDAGPDDSATTWLRRQGIGHLDLVVATHPHLDHVGGLPATLAALEVDGLWVREIPNDLPEAHELLRVAGDRRIPVARPHTGQHVTIGEMRLEVLAPDRGRPHAWSDREANDTSIVVRAQWRGRSALLTGDVELAAQAALLRRPDRLRATLLKVPHHGGGTSDRDFLRAVGAKVAVIPVGRDNRYGHPSPDVLDVLAQAGVTVHRTDRAGTVTIPVPPAGGEVATPGLASVPITSGGIVSGRTRHPDHGGRRPSPAARIRDRPGRGAQRRTRCRDRRPSRRRARPPPGSADVLALRRAHRGGHPRDRDRS